MKKKIISTVLTACMMAGMLTGTGAYSVAADSSVINMDEDPYQVAIQMVVLPGTEVADEAAPNFARPRPTRKHSPETPDKLSEPAPAPPTPVPRRGDTRRDADKV